MIAPTTLLRDTALAGFALIVAGLGFGLDVGFAVAAGAAASFLNLVVTTLVAREILRTGRAWHLPMKLAFAIAVALSLVSFLPPAPALVGFFSMNLAVLVRALAGVVRPVES